MRTLLPLLLLATMPAFAAPAACPDFAEHLREYLASAKQRVGAEGEVRVEFEAQADGRTRLMSLKGSRAYLTRVRTAMDTLQCDGGTPQRYVLDIRFAEPAPKVVQAAIPGATR